MSVAMSPSTATVQPEVDAPWQIVPVMLLAFAGVFSQGLAPFIVHGLTQYAKLTPSQAGLCVGAEMAGSALGIVAVLFLLGRMPRNRLAILALATVITGNCLCVAAGSAPAYMGARLIAGVGCGLTTCAFGIIATTRRPARYFAIFSGSSVVLMAAADACIGVLLARWGVSALFALLAVPAVVAFAFTGMISRQPMTSSRIAVAMPPGAGRRAAVLGLLANLCFFTALAAFWTYVAEIAVANGNDARRVTEILAVTFLIGGIGGSAVAALASSRVQPSAMIGSNATIMAAAVAVMVWIPGFMAFIPGATVYLLAWFVTYPFLMALLAELDPAGGLTVMGMLTQSVGWLAGPALGSLLIARGSYQRLGLLCCAGFLLAMMCSFIGKSSVADRAPQRQR